jgi:nucleoside-diphosphate-sugar epimerase
LRVLVTGACGYKGSVLVPKLLKHGHEVIAMDTMWFGNHLDENSRLRILEKDVRSLELADLFGVEAIVHLASVANDPCGDLVPKLTWEISALGSRHLAELAIQARVGQLIYASSGSVYGVKSEADVTEELDLTPISDYNKTKMVAERVLASYSDKLCLQIIRPATVCGLSPRMRLDVSVNMLTMQALSRGVMTVFGGAQVRPNVHIDDITDLYLFMLSHPEITGIFNVGFENLSIMEIAELVKARVGATIEVTPSNDPRSYRINSDKLLKTGFKPTKTVGDAITEIVAAYRDGRLTDEPRHHNLKWMQLHGVVG